MMDFNERVIPGVSANFLYQEALKRYEFACKYIRKKDKVLDIGCGTGYGTNILAKRAGFVLGIDNDKEAVEFAKRHYGNKVKFSVGDAQKLRLKDMFDVICAFEVIEHLYKPKNFIGSVKNLLKKGGTFILSTPNKKVVSPKCRVSSPYHIREYTMPQLRQLLEKYFPRVRILGQRKSTRAKEALKDFMKSQSTRQKFVDGDTLNIRKLFPKSLKEKIWKVLGLVFGLAKQRSLTTRDFPISKDRLDQSEYFIVVCQK